MLALTVDQQAALANRHVMRRDFVWCEARDPDTGDPDPAGFWNDVGTVTVEGKDYNGSGTLGQLSTLSAKSDFTIPGMAITLSGISEEVALMVRGKSISQAPITISLGIFDVDTRSIIGALIPRFIGKIDAAPITVPARGGTSTIIFRCESTSRALTIKRHDTRSQESQRVRSATDDFFKYVHMQRSQTIYFGMLAPRQRHHPSHPGGNIGGTWG